MASLILCFSTSFSVTAQPYLNHHHSATYASCLSFSVPPWAQCFSRSGPVAALCFHPTFYADAIECILAYPNISIILFIINCINTCSCSSFDMRTRQPKATSPLSNE